MTLNDKRGLNEYIQTTILILLFMVTAGMGFVFLSSRVGMICSPNIFIWSSLQNGTLKKDYTQLNDKLNITFNVSMFPINYEIKFRKNNEQTILVKGQVNNTSYSVFLKLNDTGFLDIFVRADNCGADSKVIEIITPSQIEIANINEQIKQIEAELEKQRQAREQEKWKSNVSFILSIISTIISSLILGILTIYEKFFKKPKLKMEFDQNSDLRTFSYIDTKWVRKFGLIRVKNDGKKTAKKCIAVLKIIKRPKNVKHLESNYTLHWAGITYSFLRTGSQPVDIGIKESRDLDVVFTEKNLNINGCWIAIPIALTSPQNARQAYLPPGNYTVEIKVSCEDGKVDTKKFKIFSPKDWDKLSMKLINK